MNIHKLAKITLILVYLLIFVGGFVRASGAGLGCPDWPKCFDQFIPPISEAQLPDNYQTIYADQGYGTASFNPIKTWTEYLNRVLGVTVGISVLLLWLTSFSKMKRDKPFILLSTILLLLTVFQGWLGGVVVQSALSPFIITLHMIMALLILFICIILVRRSSHHKSNVVLPSRFIRYIWILLGLFLVQLILGTQVREGVDLFMKAQVPFPRSQWLDALSPVFKFHRSFSIILFLAVMKVVDLYVSMNAKSRESVSSMMSLLVFFVVAEILIGIAMSYGSIPPYLQPFHLVFSMGILGALFQIIVQNFIHGFHANRKKG